MGRKHKHEEHENHERWVISYADMVTLLFALFVVLYALGEVKMKKLKQLKQSMAFAFHFEGHGQTMTEGLHDSGEEGGELLMPAMRIHPQKGPVMEFLKSQLPDEFEEITGRSLETELQDDTIKFSGPLSGFYEPLSKTLRRDVHEWLTRLVEDGHKVAAHIRVHIRAHHTVVSTWENGAPYRSGDLCVRRLTHLLDLMSLMGKVNRDEIKIEFSYNAEPLPPGKNWEDEAILSFFFSDNPN